MTIFINPAIVEDRLKSYTRALDKNSAESPSKPGKAIIYAGAQPATGNGALIGANVKLAEMVFPASTAGTFAAGELTVNPPSGNFPVLADGTMVWARLVSGDGTWVLDTHVGKTGDTSPIIFNTSSLQVYAGGVVAMLSFKIKEV